PVREERLRHAGIVAERMAAYLASVQDRLKAAELAKAAAQARASEEFKRRRVTAALAAAMVLLALGVAFVSSWHQKDQTERLLQVKTALEHGQNLLQTGHYADAEVAWQRGLQLTQNLWDAGELRAAIQARLGLAQRAQKAQQLHEL